MLLEQIKGMKGKIDFDKLTDADLEEVTLPQICQVLLKEVKPKLAWDKCRKKLRVLLKTNDPERLRRGILNYFAQVIQNSEMEHANVIADMMHCFKDPLYDIGAAGIWLQIKDACGSEEEDDSK